MKFFNYFSKDVGVDLGTANTLVYVRGVGIVINQPSLAAVNLKTSQVLAVGDEAKKMLSRTPPHIQVVKPLVNGVISDFEVAQQVLLKLFRMATPSRMASYRLAVVGVPSNVTEVERKSVEDVVIAAGASKAYIVEEAIAATLGAGMPIETPTSNMIVDIGGGTTDIAIISMGGIVVAKSMKIAGDHFNREIIDYIRDEFKLVIGEPTAEELKIAVGSVMPLDEKLELSIRGRDLTTGLPREIVVRSSQIRLALSRSIKQIIDSIKEVVEMAPPELVGDIYKNGIFLSGGGFLLRGLDMLVARELTVDCSIIEDPLTSVARGLGIIVERFDHYKKFLENPMRPREINL